MIVKAGITTWSEKQRYLRGKKQAGLLRGARNRGVYEVKSSRDYHVERETEVFTR